ncbi:unnamed protein product [Cuscuta epithymum]|uniref:Pectinesterase inhibitor domain-containing protein n=1 Tax=Cuscuta epithymum TaxID=186058 RepID=A0AAV0FFN1_9ASTE|nr:unnamed protein product [Cuscuta epithymum]CAH9134288.1 unnamed protein product [Cuscuta epithymum]CAH9134289.1 unnamed protein product [Cuscuta epithymum]
MKTPSSAAFPLMIIFIFTLSFNLRQLSVTAAAITDVQTDFISTRCGDATILYQSLCKSSLSPFASTVKQDLGILARVAIDVSRNQTEPVLDLVKSLFGVSNATVVAALKNCFSHLETSVGKMRSSVETMQQLNGSGSAAPSSSLEDVKLWMKAALDEENLCDRAFDQVGDMSLKGKVLGKLLLAKQLTSNAGALLLQFAPKIGA